MTLGLMTCICSYVARAVCSLAVHLARQQKTHGREARMGTRMEQIGNIVWTRGYRAAGILIWLIVTHHILVTALYVSPANPLYMNHVAYLRSYMEPFFEQRWQLFAPDPNGISKYILARCRVQTGSDQGREAGPYDATTRFEETQQVYRFGPAQRILRGLLVPIFYLGAPKGADSIAIEQKARKRKGAEYKALLAAIEKHDKQQRDSAVKLLGRVASLECRRHHSESTIRDVQAWVVEASPPKFSERFSDRNSAKYVRYALEWQPYVKYARLEGFE